MKMGWKSFRSQALSVGVVAAALLGGAGSLLALGSAPAGAATTPHTAAATGSTYTAVTPDRIADTRTGSGYEDAGQSIPANSSDTVAFPSSAVPSTATAVVLNVTAVDATANTYISVYPTGQSGNYTSFSNINVFAGTTQPNLVIVPLGNSQSDSVYNYQGTTDVVVDLEGYFSPASATSGAGHFNPLTPARITDTRSANGGVNAGKTLGAGGTLNVQVTGAGGVPSSGVSAVELNVTVANTTASSYLTAYPTGAIRPTAANLNWVAGETIPNRVIVPVGTNGQVTLFNYAGNADVVVDVDGWFSDGSGAAGTPASGDLYTPIAPARISDTRANSGYANEGAPVGQGASETVQVTGQLPVSGTTPVPAESTTAPITAAVLNVAEATATSNSFLTVYPGGSVPLAADLNFFPSFVVANADIAELSSTGSVNIYNYAGSTNVVVDVFGYFTPAATGNAIQVVASPTSIAANGSSTSSVQAIVASDAGATPVANDTVTFTLAGTPAAACGTLSQSTATTAATGLTPILTYTSSTTTGTCAVTGTESGGATFTATITQTTPTGDAVSLTATPSTVTDSGTSTSALAIGVTNATNAPVAGDAVALTGTPSVPGSCGTFPATVTTAATTGTVTATYTSSKVVGTCTITATEAGGAQATVVISQNAVSGYATTVLASPSVIKAISTDTSSIVTNVTDNGVAVSGDVVTYTLTPSTTGSCGALASPTETTAANGDTPSDVYTASPVIGTCTVTGQEANGSTVGAAVITQGQYSVALGASPTTLEADGTSTSTLSVTVTDRNGNPVGDDVVQLTLTPSVPAAGGVPSSCGTLSGTPPLATGMNGMATDTYTASTTHGSCTIEATELDSGATATLVISQTPTASYVVTVSATPTILAAATTSKSSIVTTVTEGGAASDGDVITYTLTPSVAGSCGTLSDSTATTAGTPAQTPAVTYTATAVSGTCTITAQETPGDAIGATVITQSSYATYLTATPSTVTANGTATSALAVGVAANNTGVAGETVSLAGVPSVAGACGTFPATVTTGGNGGVGATYTASSVAGTCTITATDAGTGSSATVVITQTKSVPTATNVSVNASPDSLFLVSTTSTITVTVTGTGGAAVAGQTVTLQLVNPSGLIAPCGSLSTTTGTTNASGVVTATYTAPAIVGTLGSCTVQATDTSVTPNPSGSTSISELLAL